MFKDKSDISFFAEAKNVMEIVEVVTQ